MRLLDKEVRNRMTMKLHVFLAHNGEWSRRKAFVLVQSGGVKVNNVVVIEPSFAVNPERDVIVVDSKKVAVQKYEYIMLNKAAGYVTTKSDRFASKNILELLPPKYHHLSPVGRLDKETEGLILLTNDGDTAFKLAHPKFNVNKTYFVEAEGLVDQRAIRCLERGVMIEEKKTAPAKINNVRERSKTTEFELTIHEGRKHQVRLMMDRVRHKVVYLKRIMQGPLNIGSLRAGQWRELTKNEIESIKTIGEHKIYIKRRKVKK